VLSGILVLLIFVSIILYLFINAIPAFEFNGLASLTENEWNPSQNKFGLLPFIVATCEVTIISVIISSILSIAISFVLNELLMDKFKLRFLKNLFEFLSLIPSVIYGLWGLFVLVPIIQKIEATINLNSYIANIFTTSILFVLMMLPYSTAMLNKLMAKVPMNIKEAAYSLGATKYEIYKFVILPFIKKGIYATIIISATKSISEAVAVVLIVGDSNVITAGIYNNSNTLASVLAHSFNSNIGSLEHSFIIQIAFILFIITALMKIIAKKLISKWGY
jgi:phosphate transport system permease protein